MEKEEIERFYNEARNHKDTKELLGNYYYRGFKISKKSIVDTSSSDMYSPISQENMRTIRQLGFIKGADRIVFEKDKRRVALYKSQFIKFVEEKYKAIAKGNTKKEKILLQRNVKSFGFTIPL